MQAAIRGSKVWASRLPHLADDTKTDAGEGDGTTIFDETLKCAICMDLCARPITVPPLPSRRRGT